MHLCHQSIIPGAPQGIVDLKSLGVLGLESTQVILGVHGGCAADGVWHDNCMEVIDGGIGSCHAKSIGIVLHVDGDILSLLLVCCVSPLDCSGLLTYQL